ncbi:MAG: hypothetical protein KDB15_04575 [Microthrixaceae bacterium]|nr:hypothetical protein [Microthrixaceae bacterium]
MSRRLEIELTSARPDGSWTWRAAGAKQPKGDIDGSLLPDGAAVGSVLRVEAEFMVDGIEITSVLPDKAPRKEAQTLEILGSGREEPLVTTQLAPKGRGGKGDRKRRGGGRNEGRGDGGRGDGRGNRRDRSSGPRPDPVPQRPTPKRLRPRRTHRDAALAEVPAEQRPVAEQVLRGGIPAVRDEVRKQNEAAKKENRPEMPLDQVVAMAERLLPKLRSAEWMDRAEAARADLEELDLRDLRSVVVAADGGARDETARALRDELTAGLTRRVEEEHRLWISDMEANLDAGRFVRALRLSSRPPKAGTPLPPELAQRMIDAVSSGLDSKTKQELYAAALDALSFSPVHARVTPAGKPDEPGEELMEAARRVADKAPGVAALFGVDASEANAARKRRKRSRRDAKGSQGDSRGGREGRPGGRGSKGSDQGKGAGSGKSGSQKPGSQKPDSQKPDSDAGAPDKGAKQSSSDKPDTESPEAAKPDTESPEPAQAEPETSEPETSEPETSEPETSEAAPVVDAPVVDAPVADEPAADAPSTPADTADQPAGTTGSGEAES